MAAPVIDLEHVTKTFRVSREPIRSLKESVIRTLRGRRDYENFVALDGITFAISQGERVGIIGRNGSGKSTLFRVISRILKPNRGRVTVNGKISPVIELSAGFHPELTGVENIFLNGAVYGLRREQVVERLDEILEFAGIGEFVHSPVRTYSSGMMARLAFSVAINVGADIFLFDEVLAVGDAEFQRRCLRKLRELQEQSATVVFVSHDLGTVGQICDRVIWLDQGCVVRDGEAGDVIEAYEAATREGARERE